MDNSDGGAVPRTAADASVGSSERGRIAEPDRGSGADEGVRPLAQDTRVTRAAGEFLFFV